MTESANQNAQTNGRWTKEQHQKFLLGIQMFGKNWKRIEGLIGTRTGSQIRSHAQKFFLKVQKILEPEPTDEKDSVESRSVMSNTSSNQGSTDMSYFFQKIVRQSLGHQNFDFWQQMIDHPGAVSTITENCQCKRKSSFVACDYDDSEEDGDSLGREPRKIVKI